MIKPVKGLSPVFVQYYDDQSASVYNLTQEQYDRLWEDPDGVAAADIVEKFEVELPFTNGYTTPEVAALAIIYGFEVDSE